MYSRWCLLLLFIIPSGFVHANDSAASTAAGGIQLKREARISMLKERLTISPEKVVVEYEFLNETDQDITTEVAFPIPLYELDVWSAGGMRTFDDFRLWVDGQEFPYRVAAKALLNGKDVTGILRKYKIQVQSFGRVLDELDRDGVSQTFSAQIRQLPEKDQASLVKLGLIDAEAKLPLWQVEKIYHWAQTFPAHKVLRVRHEYEPGVGFTQVDADDLDPVQRKKKAAEEAGRSKNGNDGWYAALAGQIDGACLDPALQKTLSKHLDKSTKERTNGVSMEWIDYILTTTNSWKTPIKDFEAIIRKPAAHNGRQPYYVSLCWDGPVGKAEDSIILRRKDFVPVSDLHIAYFQPHVDTW